MCNEMQRIVLSIYYVYSGVSLSEIPDNETL